MPWICRYGIMLLKAAAMKGREAMSTIQVTGLTRDYGSGRGVFDVSFAIEQGEVFGFLGPNGAGKTTAIRHLMGFLKPEKGNCTILKHDCWAQRAQIQQQVGYIPGEIAFFDDMTGTDFLDFMAQYRGLRANGKTRELLDRFELDARGKLKKMSKGMKQKIGIVAAFMHDPAVLILDEPTSGLDPLMQSRFIDLILEEKQRGKTILMSSHIFEEVERTCQRVAILNSGRLAALNSVDALKAAQVRRYVITLESDQAAAAFAREADGVVHNGKHVTVVVRSDMHALIALMARSPVTNIAAPTQSLEDVFMHYYGGERHDQ